MRGRRLLAGGLLGVLALVAACSNADKRESSAPAGGFTGAPAATSAAGSAENRAVADSGAPKAAPAPAQGAAGATNGSSGAPLPDTGRKVIYTIYMELTSKDVLGSFQRVSTIAETSGGLVADSNIRQDGENRRGTITIRVPVDRYQSVLGQIRELGKVESERSTANDVSEEFTDLQARQRNLEATEQQLLVFLGQAKTIQEVLQVQDRLNTVRSEIERIKGRLNLLTRLTDLATIQVTLRPELAKTNVDKPATGPLGALERGWDASLEVLGTAGAGVLTAVAFSWWLLPVVVALVWLVRRLVRARARRVRPAGPTLPIAPPPPAGA